MSLLSQFAIVLFSCIMKLSRKKDELHQKRILDLGLDNERLSIVLLGCSDCAEEILK
jgi:hypothetical protein